ncbi:peptidoglycan-binding protein [bacterium]|nr:peptidoglycan-binding protein [bacterium]
MMRHTTLIGSTMLLIVIGASCTDVSDAVEVPVASTIGVMPDQPADTTTPSTEPPGTTQLPTPTPTPTTTETPPTSATPLATNAPPPPVLETTEGRNPDFLRQGDEGSRVGLIQFKLIALGYLPAGGDTAVFDGATNSAVLAFQSDYGLIVDGIIGPETERAISAAAESINPEQL